MTTRATRDSLARLDADIEHYLCDSAGAALPRVSLVALLQALDVELPVHVSTSNALGELTLQVTQSMWRLGWTRDVSLAGEVFWHRGRAAIQPAPRPDFTAVLYRRVHEHLRTKFDLPPERIKLNDLANLLGLRGAKHWRTMAMLEELVTQWLASREAVVGDTSKSAPLPPCGSHTLIIPKRGKPRRAFDSRRDRSLPARAARTTTSAAVPM